MEPFSLLIVVAVVMVLVWTAAKVVPAGHVLIVERLGRHQAVLEPGLHFIIPIIDRVRDRLDTREQMLSKLREPVISRDNYVVLVDAVVFYQIVDPRSATYDVADHLQSLDDLTVSTLRTVIGGTDVEEALLSTHVINSEVRRTLSWTTERWGVRVLRVEITALDKGGTDNLR